MMIGFFAAQNCNTKNSSLPTLKEIHFTSFRQQELCSMRLAGAFTWAFAASVLGADAFVPSGKVPRAFTTLSSTTVKISEVPTTPIPGMKPGTSGLRKKVEVWQGKTGEKYYVENFIQSLLDTATASNGGQVPETYVIV